MNIAKCNWIEAKKAIESKPVVIIFGSIEEHGYHLPMNTDTIIAEQIIGDLNQNFDFCYYPAITFGQVWSAKDYEGTISIKKENLINYGKNVVQSLIKANAPKIILYSFHNGNISSIKDIQREIKDDGYEEIYLLEYASVEKEVSSILTEPVWLGIWHASELETSLLLYIDESLVAMDKAIAEYPVISKKDQLKGVGWRSFNKSGVFGNPKLASKEKGESIYKCIINKLEKDLFEILDV